MLIFVLILGVLFSGAIFFNPAIGVLGLIGLIYSNIGPLIGVSLFSMLLFYVLACMIVMKLLIEPEFTKHDIDIYLFGLTLFVLIGFVRAFDKILALEAFLEYIRSLLLFFCIVNLIKSRKFIEFSFFALIVSASFLALYSIHQFNQSTHVMRFSGVSRDANELALLISTSIPLSVSLIKTYKNMLIKLCLFVSIILIIATVFMTYSRGGFISLFFIILSLLFLERKRKIVIVLAVALFIFLLYYFLTHLAHSKIMLRLLTKDTSFIQRLQLYKGGISMFLSNPVLGVGLGNFLFWSTTYTGLITSLIAHNIFIQVAAELGIGGIFFFVAVLVVVLKTNLKSYRLAKEASDRNYLNMAEGVSIAFMSFTVGNLFLTLHFDQAYWILIGLSVAFYNLIMDELGGQRSE